MHCDNLRRQNKNDNDNIDVFTQLQLQLQLQTCAYLLNAKSYTRSTHRKSIKNTHKNNTDRNAKNRKRYIDYIAIT